MTAEDTQGTAIKITRLDERIADFDSVLKEIHELLPEDMLVFQKIVRVREAIFHLQQQMHGCDIVHFAGAEEGESY